MSSRHSSFLKVIKFPKFIKSLTNYLNKITNPEFYIKEQQEVKQPSNHKVDIDMEKEVKEKTDISTLSIDYNGVKVPKCRLLRDKVYYDLYKKLKKKENLTADDLNLLLKVYEYRDVPDINSHFKLKPFAVDNTLFRLQNVIVSTDLDNDKVFLKLFFHELLTGSDISFVLDPHEVNEFFLEVKNIGPNRANEEENYS